MKTIILNALFFVALVTSHKIQAQLSGTVTINQLVGASASNYTSFTALAAMLNSVGISGPLMVNVVPNSGPYNEQVQFKQVNGAAAGNTITINGNYNTIHFAPTSTAQAWIVNLMGADYFHFNNLISVSTHTYYGYPCMVTNGANYNRFNNCTFSCSAVNQSESIPVEFNGTPTDNNYNYKYDSSGSFNRFVNCHMFNGLRGIGLYGSSPNNSMYHATNNAFIGCDVNDWSWVGLQSYGQRGLSIKNCSFQNPNRSLLSNATIPSAIFTMYDTGDSIVGNCIQNISGVANPTNNSGYFTGIYLFNMWDSPKAQTRYYVKNNTITNINFDGGIVGISIQNVNGSIEDNTFILNNQNVSSGSGSSAGFIVNPNLLQDTLKIRNNTLSFLWGGGPNYGYFISIFPAQNFISDFNKFYVGSTGSVAAYFAKDLYSNVTYTSLAQFQQTGLDVNSTTITPIFSNTLCGTATPVSLQEQSRFFDGLTVYPNPASNKVNLNLSNTGNATYSLFDMSGRKVQDGNFATNQCEVNIGGLADGMYILRVLSDGKYYHGRILKDSR